MADEWHPLLKKKCKRENPLSSNDWLTRGKLLRIWRLCYIPAPNIIWTKGLMIHILIRLELNFPYKYSSTYVQNWSLLLQMFAITFFLAVITCSLLRSNFMIKEWFRGGLCNLTREMWILILKFSLELTHQRTLLHQVTV